jgi:hypothetical protein
MNPLTVYTCLAVVFVALALYVGRQARIVQEDLRKSSLNDE